MMSNEWIEIVRGKEIIRVRPRGLEEMLKKGWERVQTGEAQEIKKSEPLTRQRIKKKEQV